MFGQKDYLINNGLLKCDLYFQTLIDFIIALAKQSKSAGVQLNSWWRHQMSGRRRIVLKLRRITACATIEIYVAFPEFFSCQNPKPERQKIALVLSFLWDSFQSDNLHHWTSELLQTTNAGTNVISLCFFAQGFWFFVCLKMIKSLKNTF